jgi:ubiquinone/menaquinone biosynthesis C-methylase UbiE
VVEGLTNLGRGAESARVRELLGPSPPRRLLDVGGRTGAFTARFAAPGGEVTVLEPEARVVEIGERRHPNFRYVAGRGEQIPYSAGAFDGVTAIRSTHHMDDPEQFFREAHRTLSPGGRLVLEELTPGSGLARLFSRMARRSHHHPMDFRGPSDWVRGLVEAGFVDVQTETGPRWFFVTGRKPAGEGVPTPAGPGPSP